MSIKTPCETIVWYILPFIRKEIAKNLIENHELTQRQAAKKLGLTESAVSQYLSNKRGDIDIPSKKIEKEIEKSAHLISNNGVSTVIPELCRICKLMKTHQTPHEKNSK